MDALAVKTLKIRFFEQADENWLDFVFMCREKGGTPHDYDMVIGPTADDDTMLCLKTYWDGLYGTVDSTEAKRILLNNLETENLGIQYFIGKQEVVDHVIKSMEMELYELLLDTDTRLFLEPNEFLIRCCEMECDKGKEALYKFINAD